MKSYEVVYILDATLSPAAVEAKLARFHAALGGEVTAEDHWGARRLAYPIGNARTGYYVIAHVTVDPNALPEFERLLRLDEETIRYLVVLDEGQPTSGASLLAERPHVARPASTSERGADASAGEEDEARAEGEADAPGDAESEAESVEAPDSGPAAEAPDAEDEAAEDAGAADGEGEARETPEAEAAGEEDADAGTEDGKPDGDEAAAEPPRPSSGPPEFSGARGRRRRHEGPPIELLNYKDVTTLARFLTEQGKILPKRTTKVSARFQRSLGTAVKRARFVALLPYVKDHEG